MTTPKCLCKEGPSLVLEQTSVYDMSGPFGDPQEEGDFVEFTYERLNTTERTEDTVACLVCGLPFSFEDTGAEVRVIQRRCKTCGDVMLELASKEQCFFCSRTLL